MNSDSPIFDDQPRAPSSGSNSLMLILLLVLAVVVLGGGFLWMYQQVSAARIAARRSMSKNNLKQLGLAMHNYYDVYGTLPASASLDEQGNPRQGWTYSILPFVDQSPLFEQIDDHYAWDDPRNIPHTRLPLPIYQNPAITETMSGDGYGLSHYAGNSQLFSPGKYRTFREVTDGLSGTLMLGEINEGFEPWAKPVQVRDPALGLNKGPDTFGSPFQGGVHFLMGDGAVRFLSDDIDPQVLKALATPDGGEQIDRNW